MDYLRVKKHREKFLDYSWIYNFNIATILKEKNSFSFFGGMVFWAMEL